MGPVDYLELFPAPAQRCDGVVARWQVDELV